MINGSSTARSEKTFNSLHGLRTGGLFVNLFFPYTRWPYLVVSLEPTCACYPLAPLRKPKVRCDSMNHLDDKNDKNTEAIGNEAMTTYH